MDTLDVIEHRVLIDLLYRTMRAHILSIGIFDIFANGGRFIRRSCTNTVGTLGNKERKRHFKYSERLDRRCGTRERKTPYGSIFLEFMSKPNTM